MQHAGQDTVLIIDYGSQYTQLIARVIRQLKIYCEVAPPTITGARIKQLDPAAIILSGGPGSVNDEDGLQAPDGLFEDDRPILGICYGLQLMAHTLGGKVAHSDHHEYGRSVIQTETKLSKTADKLLKAFDGAPELNVWMSHGDRVEKLPENFERVAGNKSCPFAIIAHKDKPWMGLQFHPEVSHTPRGTELLEGFLFNIVGLRPKWTMQTYLEKEIADLKSEIADDAQVICALSGGVDSSVVAAMLGRAIGSRLHCIFVDTGLLREGEVAQVREVFGQALKLPLHVVDAKEQFITGLTGVTDPEEKRKFIGKAFIEIFEREAKGIKNAKYLAQGTLYPDVIESMGLHGHKTTIKSHHNVGGLPERMKLELVEPLRELFKDEVRLLGEALGLPHNLCHREPFPGPGLAVRVIGPIDEERLKVIRAADSIIQEEIGKSPLRPSIWQAFAILLPVRSVGVRGDSRSYDETIVIRVVESADGMTADWVRLPDELLSLIAARISNEVRGVGRVLYDVSSKPPATIEWE